VSKDEIVSEVIRLLREHVAGSRGSVHQDPYKKDFFNQFAHAYNAGYLSRSNHSDFLSAQVLLDIIEVREPELFNHDSSHSLKVFWQEWTYAWSNLSLKRDD
jgi:hypothetical protein